MEDKDLYKILGCNKTDTQTKIKKSIVGKIYYPNKITQELQQKQNDIWEAYEILSNYEYREIYDEKGYEYIKKYIKEKK
jgi:DnaJ-class molecular chaperone